MAEQQTQESSTTASDIDNMTLEVDTDLSDAVSTISHTRAGNTAASSNQSNIHEFVEENGRRYHKYKEGKYMLPNDEIEQNRLDIQHHMVLVLLEGKLHLAPISANVGRVLDVGTGTGIWAIEFAMQYPTSQVTGSDLSPIQPQSTPANCHFEIADAEDDWTFGSAFEFIHMRGMMSCFTAPRSILSKAFDSLSAGGYLEMQDAVFPLRSHDGTLEGTALDRWSKACVEGAAKIGRPWTNTPRYRGWMNELGFEHVHETLFEVPTSTWAKGEKAKELGVWFQADLLHALGASMAVLTRGLGWQVEDVERLLELARKDIRDRRVHAYMSIHVVYGRKPAK